MERSVRGRKRTSTLAREASPGTKRTRERTVAAEQVPVAGRRRGLCQVGGRTRGRAIIQPCTSPVGDDVEDTKMMSTESKEIAVGSPPVPTVQGAVSETIKAAAGTVSNADAKEISPTSSTSINKASIKVEGISNANSSTEMNLILLFRECVQEILRIVRDATLRYTDPRLGGCFQIAQDLPTFSGNPLEWMHFEATYRSSTRFCQFTERQNISRLFKALRGQAREVVKTLLCTTTEAEPIMEILKLNFGNKFQIAEKILEDTLQLPSLKSGKINIEQFATRLKNSISSFKFLKMTEYINSIDLLRSVVSKIPQEKIDLLNRYVPSNPSMTCLEKLSEFLYQESELAIPRLEFHST